MIGRAPLKFRGNEALRAHLGVLHLASMEVIGQSRRGQDLFGITFGTGPRRVSIIAGSHADEPVGPATAQALPLILEESPLLEQYTFVVVPQINPDGADDNRAWFSEPPDLVRYAAGTVREPPGDDIEFGFGEDGRPENLAAMDFLSEHAPFVAHFSLHGMAFAEGAWYLICREWGDRTEGLRERLAARTAALDMPLHDIDRGGEKGFHRIAPGFCTTPTSTGMKAFFQDDPEMAARFLPSSMEFVQSLGGDPLCMVSELPLFRIGKRSPSLEESVYWEVIDRFKSLRDTNGAGPEDIKAIARDFALEPVPIATQSALQVAMIEEALAALPSA